MRLLDPRQVARRGLSAVAYQLIGPNDLMPTTHAETLARLRGWGLPVEAHWQRCEGVAQVLAYCDRWKDARRSLPFETFPGNEDAGDDYIVLQRQGCHRG